MVATLMQGDCLLEMAKIDASSIDFILADIPYGISACSWDTVIPVQPMWHQIWRVLKPDGACVLFGSEPFSSALRTSQAKYFKYDWVWEKHHATGFLNAKKMPLKAHEIISVFYRKLPKYYPQKTKGHAKKSATRITKTELYRKADKFTSYSSTERYPRSVIKFCTDKQKSNYHPTQKPIALLEYLIKTYTVENEAVLDFTMGSGSAGVAAMNLNRKFIGIELDKGYFEIAKTRIHKET